MNFWSLLQSYVGWPRIGIEVRGKSKNTHGDYVPTDHISIKVSVTTRIVWQLNPQNTETIDLAIVQLWEFAWLSENCDKPL